MSIGVAYADYDHDGWVDLSSATSTRAIACTKTSRDRSRKTTGFRLNLVGAGPINRDAVGARVYVTTPNGITQMQEVISGSSVMAGNDLAQYFGLGGEGSAEVRIRWSNGEEQVIQNVKADQRYRIQYGETALAGPACKSNRGKRRTSPRSSNIFKHSNFQSPVSIERPRHETRLPDGGGKCQASHQP
jgi:hypothetical protein